jgi:peptide deformylase
MKIVHYPHPALRHPARPVTTIDKPLRLLVGRMLELMQEKKGLGLAGPQVAMPFQVFVMQMRGEDEQPLEPRVYINPMVIERKGSIEGEEGCLSFPGLYQKVRRAKQVRVQAFDVEGQQIDRAVSDLEARVVLHEIDHLHGVLFIDKFGLISKLSARSALAEFEREYRKARECGEIPPDKEIERQLRELEQTGPPSGDEPTPDDGGQPPPGVPVM